MKAWLKIASLGLLIGACAAGCTITTGDDDDIEGANVGGTHTTGGRSGNTGGKEVTATGGEAGDSGTASGGSAGDGSGGTSEPGQCELCLQDNCGDELDACAKTDDQIGDPDAKNPDVPDDVPDCVNEYNALLSCIQQQWDENGLYYTDLMPDGDGEDVLEYCAGEATLNPDGIILSETNDLIACTNTLDHENCEIECWDLSVGAGGAGG
jgi:hypothetical protein